MEYEFSRSILSADWKKVLNNFLLIKQSVFLDIDKLKQQYKFKKVNIIGISLGCINALMAANHNADVKNLYLILPGHCLAESLWKGDSTQELKEDLKNRNHNLLDLKEYWYDLAPENNIDDLKSENILIFLSEADKTIPFDHGKELLEKLRLYNYSIKYKKTKYLKHWIAAMLFYLKPRKFL